MIVTVEATLDDVKQILRIHSTYDYNVVVQSPKQVVLDMVEQALEDGKKVDIYVDEEYQNSTLNFVVYPE